MKYKFDLLFESLVDKIVSEARGKGKWDGISQSAREIKNSCELGFVYVPGMTVIDKTLPPIKDDLMKLKDGEDLLKMPIYCKPEVTQMRSSTRKSNTVGKAVINWLLNYQSIKEKFVASYEKNETDVEANGVLTDYREGQVYGLMLYIMLVEDDYIPYPNKFHYYRVDTEQLNSIFMQRFGKSIIDVARENESEAASFIDSLASDEENMASGTFTGNPLFYRFALADVSTTTDPTYNVKTVKTLGKELKLDKSACLTAEEFTKLQELLATPNLAKLLEDRKEIERHDDFTPMASLYDEAEPVPDARGNIDGDHQPLVKNTFKYFNVSEYVSKTIRPSNAPFAVGTDEDFVEKSTYSDDEYPPNCIAISDLIDQLNYSDVWNFKKEYLGKVPEKDFDSFDDEVYIIDKYRPRRWLKDLDSFFRWDGRGKCYFYAYVWNDEKSRPEPKKIYIDETNAK